MDQKSTWLNHTTDNLLFINKLTIEQNISISPYKHTGGCAPSPTRKDDTAAIVLHSIRLILSEHYFE